MLLYNRRSHTSALFCLLTTTTTRALYVPSSKIIPTTTTGKTFVWSDQIQIHLLDPSNEDTATLPFTCFTCPMNPKLLRQIHIFAPVRESKDPEPRVLLCEYDTNESPCRYDSDTGKLLGDQPSGDSCIHSASVAPECARASPWSLSSLLGGQNETEAKISPLAPSHEDSEQNRHSRDSALSYVRKDTSEAIPIPARTSPQHHFSAPDAALHYVDLEDDHYYDRKPLNLDPNTLPPPPPAFLNAPLTSPSPLDYELDIDSVSDEEKNDYIAPAVEITPTLPTVTAYDYESDPDFGLLFDLEFEDYSDAFKMNMEVMPTPDPARGPREERADPVDDKVAYIMGMTVGE